jgi:hypothetical protein
MDEEIKIAKLLAPTVRELLSREHPDFSPEWRTP